jgi:peptidoglycan/xylan/chitin deacetylase (PgdA/CDA1 family)
MIRIFSLLPLVSLLSLSSAQAQNATATASLARSAAHSSPQVPDGKPWNGRQCAVVLTYDDAIDVDLDNVVPALDSAGLKGTFYLIGSSPAISRRIPEWRAAAKNGHELGNHTSFHPCDGQLPGRAWIKPENDLSLYTIPRMTAEIRMTNTLLAAIDGKTERTFAYPCGDKKIGNVNYFDAVRMDFVAARGTHSAMLPADSVDLEDIPCYAINGQTAGYMIGLVQQAMATHTLLVFLFHGVGGGHDMNVALADHSMLIHYLRQQKTDIWVPTLLDAAKYIRKNRQHLQPGH